MTIHVVSPGQSLSSVAAEYGVGVGLLASWNGLAANAPLAVGQSLLVLSPKTLYTVRPGDTLYTIAGRFGVTARSLLRNNPALNGRNRIYPGQVLVIAYRETPQETMELSGYAYPFVDEGVLRGILPYARLLMPFTYGFTADGALIPLDDRRLIQLAGEYGVLPYLHLSTLTEEGAFSSARAAQLFRDPAAQELLLAELVSVGRRGATGESTWTLSMSSRNTPPATPLLPAGFGRRPGRWAES